MKYGVLLDPFQIGWLWSHLDDYKKSLGRDYKNLNKETPVVDSILKELTETLMSIKRAES